MHVDTVQCPRCEMTGTVRGVKHHYTSIHNEGKSGGLYVTHLPITIPVVVEKSAVIDGHTPEEKAPEEGGLKAA